MERHAQHLIPAGGHGPVTAHPNGTLAKNTVWPATWHCREAVTPRPYTQPLAFGVRATPATPTMVAVHVAHELMLTTVPHAWTDAWPDAVAPQQSTLYATLKSRSNDTAARVTVALHIRKLHGYGIPHLWHQSKQGYGIR